MIARFDIFIAAVLIVVVLGPQGLMPTIPQRICSVFLAIVILVLLVLGVAR